MAEDNSEAPAPVSRKTYSRRQIIVGGIVAASSTVAVAVGLDKHREEQERYNRRLRYDEEARKNLAKLSQSISNPAVTTATQQPEQLARTQEERVVEIPTRERWLKDGYSNEELATLSKMIAQQEKNLIRMGITDEIIKEYDQKYRILATDILNKAEAITTRIFAQEIKDLFHCLILAESIGNPTAVSSAGAVGLSQLMPIGALNSFLIIGNSWKKEPEKHKDIWNIVKKSNPKTANINNPKDLDLSKISMDDFKKQNLVDPSVNLSLGAVEYLSLVARFDDNMSLAISAYNAGSGKMKQALDLYWKKEGDPAVRPTNKPNFVELFERRKELGLDPNENNENYVYFPRIVGIYRKIHGSEVFPLTA